MRIAYLAKWIACYLRKGIEKKSIALLFIYYITNKLIAIMTIYSDNEGSLNFLNLYFDSLEGHCRLLGKILRKKI